MNITFENDVLYDWQEGSDCYYRSSAYKYLTDDSIIIDIGITYNGNIQYIVSFYGIYWNVAHIYKAFFPIRFENVDLAKSTIDEFLLNIERYKKLQCLI